MSVEIPNYRIIEKLGIGAQTRVYRARCMPTGKDYTVKIVKIVNPEDASFIDLLKAEYAIGSAIDHPVIRKVYELRLLRQRFRVRGAVIFMEYVNGLTLADKEFQKPLDEVLRIFGEVADGLHSMHVAGYVHADLKPNNIMLAVDGAVKLIDLGQSSKIFEPKSKIQGTVDYMAPEQVQRGKLDQRTDVFGLGAALNKILTGRAIVTDMNQTVNLQSQSPIVRRVDEPRPAGPELPTCVTRLIADCCQYNPADRPRDMPDIKERISLARAIVAKKTADDTAAPASEAADDDAALDLAELEMHIDEDFEDELGLGNKPNLSGPPS